MKNAVIMNSQHVYDNREGEENSFELTRFTPLRMIQLYVQGAWRDVFLKLESQNFSGSIKGRTALSLIASLEERGVLGSGKTLIESTSGNLGVALAMIARNKGYRFIAVIDPKTTDENVQKLKKFGAEIEFVAESDEHGGYLLSRLRRIRELCQRNTELVWTNQYENPANPTAHFTTTAPEIWEQMNRDVGAVLVPVSTGGTLAGVGRYFRQYSPNTQVVGVDAYGSIVFEDTPSPRKLTGIGASRKSSFLSKELYDDYFLIRDEPTFAFCHALKEVTGITIGGSSGATLAAAYQFLLKNPSVERIVCLCPDGGDNYLNSIYNPEWIQANNFKTEDVSKLIRLVE